MLDALFAVLTVFFEVYLIYDIEAVIMRWGQATNLDVFVGSIYILLVLEASRRSLGLPMVLIAVFFIVQTQEFWMPMVDGPIH